MQTCEDPSVTPFLADAVTWTREYAELWDQVRVYRNTQALPVHRKNVIEKIKMVLDLISTVLA